MNILDASNHVDYSRWCEYWNTCNGKEVYAHPDYLGLYTDEKTKAMCAILIMDGQTLVYPFLLRDLSGEVYYDPSMGKLHDIVTPYGYGGVRVYGEGDFKRLHERFNWEFKDWAKANHIVSGFDRFYLNSHCLELYDGETEYNNDNIVVDLTLDQSTMWASFKPKVRKNVNRAKKCNVTIEEDPEGKRINEFLSIYYSTMNRCHAGSDYYFPKEYFEMIHSKLKGQYMYFHAIRDQNVIATELVLVSDYNIYSFLGGTKSEYFELRPNDLLKYEIINWGSRAGKKSFVLGGGYVPRDGIFDYKYAFAPDGVRPFYIGKRIFDKDAYDALVEKRKALSFDFDASSRYFPLYRG